ncbi:BAG family molecular chaperone regulator 1 [Dendrobium catenatum]|uniref:BAG family molecular chaperone regulator 1 n=1 Tax=Dendrobium catenatum TaxID=906689 RepID=A0A2I0XH10_9ASPA|nr:BAG family molecular chaperone regulator 1 [Dendrobium catenatum]
MEEPSSRERRYIEMRRNAKIQSSALAIAALSLEVDKYAAQVPELQITTLIELLMRQAVKLDGIVAEGDTSFQKTLLNTCYKHQCYQIISVFCRWILSSTCEGKSILIIKFQR